MKQKYSQGYSLLELFIALTIGLILLAGLLHIFLVSKRSAMLESGFGAIQENARFIQAYVQRVIRLAGYRSTPTNSTVFTSISTVFTGGTSYIAGTNATGPSGSDTLTVRFQGSGNGTGTPDGTIRDCLDRAIDANTVATSTFSINNNFEFQCQANNPNAAPVISTQSLISGVENFKVLYGEDLDGDNIANRYVPANYAGLNMANVVSLRISLLLRSDQLINPYNEQPTFYLAGTTYTPAASDKYLRKVMTFTILLRNLMSSPT